MDSRDTLRRIFQTIAFLVMILTGSMPGLQAALLARGDACCASMDADGCPCSMPSRAPGPAAPCGLEAAGPAALIQAPDTAPERAAQARLQEPSPVPPALQAPDPARSPAAAQQAPARPSPAPPFPSRLMTQAALSLFRI